MPRFDPRDTSGLSDLDYQNYILQGVSRTFALTIPQLPPALRDVVGNAYLLCRLADTIEDDAEMPAAEKADFAEQLIAVIDKRAESASFASRLQARLAPATPVAEQDLVANTCRVMRLTHGFSDTQIRAMSRCVAIMSRGMVRYQSAPPVNGTENMAALDDYCYHVAGVVGEMLSDLFDDYYRQQCLTDAPERQAVQQLAVSFGQGLQMTNILKDIWDDQQRNICWLPRSIFAHHGVDLSDLASARDSEGFAQAINALVGIAATHLRDALDYTLAIPRQEKGLRRFCLWAIAMALLSLRNIHRRPHFTAAAEVKISRRTMRAAITISSMAAGHDLALRMLFNLVARGLPMQPPTSASTLAASGKAVRE